MSLLIRTQQHWLPRSVDILLTVIAWVGFLSLIYIGVKGLLKGVPADLRLSVSSDFIQTLHTLLLYVLGGVLMGVVLLVWAKYSEVKAGSYERREWVSPIGIETLSSSFRVSETIIDFLQNEQVWIVHNYEHGDLSAIEIPSTGLVLPAYADYKWVQQAFSEGPDRFMAMIV